MIEFIETANLWKQFIDFMNTGGYVMPPLLFITIVLWYALAYRASMIRINTNNPRRLIQKRLEQPEMKSKTIMEEAVVIGLETSRAHTHSIRKNLDVLFSDYYIELKKYRSLITVLLVIAPLLGLLGTVSGMIETFDSLQDMTFMSQDGGIAKGISQALITTQFGLSISVPGLVFHSYINRKQTVVEQELEQLIDIFSSQTAEQTEDAK
ncbi:MotA/TolQ/ExbB proton channel family protein [Hydrogenovibrio sp. SC-1]|uniref:MotA/TolQ/ExbB proton channel family protein n=1 Tax=Hydrogenovibrio sp. SC-1 TaxID=2065820 RepID=UPI000C7E4C0E|nr:MotA/TolQ/ExbB proton channel family protein [Hydrogenovibrio sp. SC-1]PLA75348.1 MotA/TolQ/ExbB proton channel family protein [Hydrogenovibrio sp. SC-1]